MDLPSGDHAGVRSITPGVLVRLRTSPFSAGTVSTSPCASNTARTPVGEMRGVAQFARHVLEARPHFVEVGGDLDVDGVFLAAGDVVDVHLPELLVDDAARSGAGRHDVLAGVPYQLGDLLRLGIVAEESHRAIAIGEEIGLVADPHRIDIVGIGARHFDCGEVGEIDHPEIAGRTASIPLPRDEVGEARCELPAIDGCIDHALAIGRIGAHAAHGQRQRFGKAAFGRHRIKLRVSGLAEAIGAEQNALAVGSPAHHAVGVGMIGDALGNSAGTLGR